MSYLWEVTKMIVIRLKIMKRKMLCNGLILLCLLTFYSTLHCGTLCSSTPATIYTTTQEHMINEESVTPITLATKSLSVNVTLNSTQVERGAFIGINVTITNDKTPVRVSNISMFYKRGNVEHNTTEFQELSKGVYFTAVNTTSLSPGWWKVKILVEQSGTTIENNDNRFAVVLTLKKREYPSPIFLALIILSTIAVVLAITHASRNLSTQEEEVKI